MNSSITGNADRFLAAFNNIERHLKKKLQLNRYENFTSMLYQLEGKDAFVRRYMSDLLEFAELRNAIVHSRNGDEVIAYPTEKAVAALEEIRDGFLNPEIIKSKFRKTVITIPTDEKLSVALHLFQKYDISQIPVMNGKEVVEIINGNTVARWLVKQDVVCPEETPVAELLPSIERKKNFAFMPEKTDIYTCADKYASSLNKGWYYDAIFMTWSGKNGEGLTGIIVLEDIAPYLLENK
ncbi:CBS domain-containing protein [Flavisolibacter sp. BT320]|nr:CBS domain-containing protein [Flavisolibacter longurius]